MDTSLGKSINYGSMPAVNAFQKLLEKRRRMLRHKSSYVKLGTICFGLPFAVAELWLLGGHGGVGLWLFIVLGSFAVAWVWASLMWVIWNSTVLSNKNVEANAATKIETSDDA